MDIVEIRQRVEKATPGPWSLQPAEWECDCGGDEDGHAHKAPDQCRDGWWLDAAWVAGPILIEHGDGWTGFNDADADFMAHAREDVPALCNALEAAEAALAEYKADIPWESMWAYFSHGDYGPDDWQEVDEWIRTNMPRGIARTWLGMPEVQP